MSLHELTNEMNSMAMEQSFKHQNTEPTEVGHHERGHLTRKSSTSSNCSSGFDKKRGFYRKDSEVKMEAIFKELFSPDAQIIDHFEGESILIPGVEVDESPNIEVTVPNHDRFKLRRQTSLIPKNDETKRNASPQPRIRLITRKSPSAMRKLSTPTAPRKRSSSSKAPLPKLSAPPSLKPNFVTIADEALTGSYLRKNLSFLLFITSIKESPLGQEDENEELTTTRGPDLSPSNNEDILMTHPTFTVQRLDAPIERIEIRLIDDNSTGLVPEATGSDAKDVNDGRALAGKYRNEVMQTSEQPTELAHASYLEPSPAPTEPDGTENDMYKKVEYVVQPTSFAPTQPIPKSEAFSTEPIVIGEDPSYYSTMSPDRKANAEIQAKAWISVTTSVPKFEGDIDEDDLPPPPASEDTESEEPEEECLSNKDKLSEEVIERLRSETAMYYRLVRQRNEQQKEFCGGQAARDAASEMYRRCSNWRAEKLVYYYKLMRKTYCQVDNWPNSPKIKKTYGEYLNLFGTFYAFQK